MFSQTDHHNYRETIRPARSYPCLEGFKRMLVEIGRDFLWRIDANAMTADPPKNRIELSPHARPWKRDDYARRRV